MPKRKVSKVEVPKKVTASSPLCFVCNKPIQAERIAALKMLGRPSRDWTHVQCSVEKAKKGIFMGEHGTSELKLVARVYNDSVKSMFSGQEEQQED